MTTISITSIESRIRQEWGPVSAFFALHPFITHAVALVGAYFAGAVFKGWPL